jgi:hypothetical protein
MVLFKQKSLSSSRIKQIIFKGHDSRVIDLTESGVDVKSLRTVSKYLRQQSQAFHEIELYGNDIGDEGVSALIELVNSALSITTIKLEFNGITSSGAHELAEFLKVNKNITMIDLYANTKIGDAGAVDFAILLCQNTSLEYLGLFSCGITNIGAKAIIKAVKNYNKTIKSINLYNNKIDDELLEYLDQLLRRNKGENIDITSHIDLEDETESTDWSQYMIKASMKTESAATSVTSLPKFTFEQPLPCLEKEPISISTNVIQWEQERNRLITLLDKLQQQRRQNMILLNKESDYIFDERVMNVSLPVVTPQLRLSSPSSLSSNTTTTTTTTTTSIMAQPKNVLKSSTVKQLNLSSSPKEGKSWASIYANRTGENLTEQVVITQDKKSNKIIVPKPASPTEEQIVIQI